jgi:photosystem II stability/assembly factor-like uncharacterized protein
MKHFILFLLSGLIFTSAALAQKNWSKINTAVADKNGNTLFLDVVNANVVWASMEQNVDGAYYNPVPKVIRTIDGGASWQQFTVSADPADLITSITAVDETTAFVTTFSFADYTGKLIGTKDGGLTWTIVPDAFRAPGNFPDAVTFTDKLHGAAFGDPVNGVFTAFVTADGGDTWTTIPSKNLPDPLAGETGDFSASSSKFGVLQFGTTGNRVIRSTDGGQTYTAVSLPPQNPLAYVGDIEMSDAMNGILVYSYNHLTTGGGGQPKPLRTTDGGLTWKIITDSNADQFDQYGQVSFVPGTPGTFVCGGYTGYFYTHDYGVNWIQVEDEQFRIPAVECLDPQTCFGTLWSDHRNTGVNIARWTGIALTPKTPQTPSFPVAISPNPSIGSFNVIFKETLAEEATLYLITNGTNEVVRTIVADAASSQVQFNTAGLKSGIYWLRIVSGTRVVTQKVFINLN